MLRRKTQILVHVKERDPGPIHPAHFGQLLQEPDLRIARGEDDNGAPLRHQNLLKIAFDLAGGLLHKLVLRRINAHAQRIDDEILNRLGHG